MSEEEYEKECRKRFTQENIVQERVITYQMTKNHVRGLTRMEKQKVRRQSSLLQWDPEKKILYYTGHRDSKKREVVRNLSSLRRC
ncbi:hypothetical protein E2C01_066620 [Portunus trituberculatus]|uniref:Uncharacterized protein n=1 Tax=Portunus trituberculatus TaxID=210409 RepID=A0A5B7HRD2_PORTR|nr:hypothetical protein [Portunus trituberculatus]